MLDSEPQTKNPTVLPPHAWEVDFATSPLDGVLFVQKNSLEKESFSISSVVVISREWRHGLSSRRRLNLDRELVDHLRQCCCGVCIHILCFVLISIITYLSPILFPKYEALKKQLS